MAQAEGAGCTELGMGEMIRLLAGETATELQSIQGVSGACDGATNLASTFANPGGATKIVANGFTVVDADTVAAATSDFTDDMLQLDHVFTATAAQSVTGFHCMNNDDDVTYGLYCFAAAVETQSDDTITCQLTFTITDVTA